MYLNQAELYEKFYRENPPVILGIAGEQVEVCDDGHAVVAAGGHGVINVVVANLKFSSFVEIVGVAAVTVHSDIHPLISKAFSQFAIIFDHVKIERFWECGYFSGTLSLFPCICKNPGPN